ncbi:class I SAM-dependent methyltransferase [Acidobacteria bacterium AH-259-A15]|nr:class I SAM-dependent methyltransferase [Acidobacteria bacterium AH-259-A15]
MIAIKRSIPKVERHENSEALAQMWTDFIDWEKRRRGENGFLIKTLRENGCRKIFDAALGDGCDSVYLLQNDFGVISNEIDPHFRSVAIDNAKKNKVGLELTNFDWRKLSRHFDPQSFDALLCLGNSLTLLRDKIDRISALRNFRKILKPGGILIIDERNYSYMFKNKKSILAGRFNYKRKVVYCGTAVEASPIVIQPDVLVMRYVHTVKGLIGCLEMYPFKENQLLQEILTAGFEKPRRYGDFVEGNKWNVDFFTYVARCPLEKGLQS